MEADRFFGEISPPDLPLVRFYTWERPTISFGCNQNPVKRIDLAACRRDQIPVVQRPTGGRELLHGYDLCYCVAMPRQAGISVLEAKQAFAFITDVLVRGLGKMGMNAEWQSLSKRPRAMQGPCFAQVDAGEITVEAKKLVASAQRVFERCVIQEGSIPLTKPAVELVDYLNTSDKESMRNMIDSNTAFLYDCIGNESSIDAIVESFKLAFAERFASPGGPADDLINAFYSDNKSNLWYYE
jgi:lipoate-protein ligase A